MSKPLPRGVRNNNPGNIRRTADPWQGLAETQADEAFFVFTAPKWGIRALARILITYQDKHGCRTVRDFISRWAPATENDSRSYIAAVVDACAVGPDDPIDVHRYADARALVEAIIAHECANYGYAASVIDAGLVLAGIEPPVKPSRTIRGAQLATAGSVATGALQAADTVDQLRLALGPLEDVWPWMKVACVALTLIGIGIVVYARLDDQRRGLR